MNKIKFSKDDLIHVLQETEKSPKINKKMLKAAKRYKKVISKVE